MPITKKVAIIGAGATTVLGGGMGIFYLSQSKTIKNELISKNFQLIETNTEYEVNFKELKGNAEFINELKKSTNNIENTSELSKGRIALKTWCDINLALNLTRDNEINVLPKVKKYCTKLPTTIKGKYEKDGRRWINNWETKLASLKTALTSATSDKDDALVKDLGVNDNNALTGKDISSKLEKWCNDNILVELNKQESDEISKKVEKRCLEPK